MKESISENRFAINSLVIKLIRFFILRDAEIKEKQNNYSHIPTAESAIHEIENEITRMLKADNQSFTDNQGGKS